MPNEVRTGLEARLGLVLVALFVFILCSSNGQAAPPPGEKQQDISVTTYLGDVDFNGLPTTIASDGMGAYQDGVAGVSSILTANTCNGLTWGDWRFNSASSANRSVSESFFSGDAVVPGDPHYQAPANPPYWGSQLQRSWMNVQCTCTGKDMFTMTGGSRITCPLNNAWYDSAGDTWAFSPARSFTGHLDETDVQITCNSTGADGYCNDWFIDPDPAEGTEAVGRLGESVPAHPAPIKHDDGDFYMRLHIHITRP